MPTILTKLDEIFPKCSSKWPSHGKADGVVGVSQNEKLAEIISPTPPMGPAENPEDRRASSAVLYRRADQSLTKSRLAWHPKVARYCPARGSSTSAFRRSGGGWQLNAHPPPPVSSTPPSGATAKYLSSIIPGPSIAKGSACWAFAEAPLDRRRHQPGSGIYKKQTTPAENHIGDGGTQFGRVVLAISHLASWPTF